MKLKIIAQKINAKCRKMLTGIVTGAVSLSLLATSAFASGGSSDVSSESMSSMMTDTLAILTSIVNWFFGLVMSNFILLFFFGCSAVLLGIRLIRKIIAAVKSK